MNELLSIIENDGIESTTGGKAFKDLADKLVEDVDNGNLVGLLTKLDTCAQDSNLSDADDGAFGPGIVKVMRGLSALLSLSETNFCKKLFGTAKELYEREGMKLHAPNEESFESLAHQLLLCGYVADAFAAMKEVVESLINPAPEG